MSTTQTQIVRMELRLDDSYAVRVGDIFGLNTADGRVIEHCVLAIHGVRYLLYSHAVYVDADVAWRADVPENVQASA